MSRRPTISTLASLIAEEVPRAGSRLTDARADQLRQEGRDVLALSGHPQVTLPEHVVEAALRAARENAAAPSRGLACLRQAVVEHIAHPQGVELNPDRHVLITSGAMQALNLVFRTLLNPGDEVLIPSPCFFFGGMVQLAGGYARYVAMDAADGYRWDLERIERAISPRTKLLLVNSPVNPTGYTLSAEECRAIAEMADRHGLMVVSDEAYERFVFDGRAYVSMLPAKRLLGDRLVVIRSTSKSYAMSNWRVGYILASAGIVELLTKLLEWEQLTSNRICQAAAAAAICGPQDWMEEVVQQFARRRDLLWKVLQALPGIRTSRPMGGPFFFLDVTGMGSPASQIAEDWLDQFGIPTTAGDAFAAPGHLRLAFGVRSDPVINELSARLRRAVNASSGLTVAGRRWARAEARSIPSPCTRRPGLLAGKAGARAEQERIHGE